MDQMIKIVQNSYYRKTFSPEDIQKLGNYLLGEAELDSIKGTFGQGDHRYIYGSHQDIEDISAACKQDKSMLARLGRFLLLAKHLGNFHRLVERLLEHGLSQQQIFIDSGIGPMEILAYYAEEGTDCKPTLARALELLAKEHPGTIERYVSGGADSWGNAFRVLAWHCGQKKIDLLDKGDAAEMLGIYTLFFAAGVAKHWGPGEETRLRNALQESFPEALAILQGKEVAGELKKKDSKACRNYYQYLFGALALSGYRLPQLNKVMAALCRANYHEFMSGLSWACRQQHWPTLDKALNPFRAARNDPQARATRDEEKVQSQAARLEYMGVLLGWMGIDPANLCAWAYYTAQYDVVWSKAAAQLYAGDSVLLGRALPLCISEVGAPIARALCALGQPLPADTAKNTLQVFYDLAESQGCPQEETETVAAWLLTGEGDVNTLPPMEKFFDIPYSYRCNPPRYDFDLAVWALIGLHPMADRYLQYLVKGLRPYNLQHLIHYMGKMLGCSTGEIISFLLKNAPAGPLIVTLAENEKVSGEYSDDTLKQVFRDCVAAQTDAAAQALPQGGADARLILLKTIYELSPDYDSQFLIGCLGDKSKQMRQRASELIAQRPQLADSIRPLTEAKKKDIREAAQKLMIGFGDAPPEPEAEEDPADILAFCKKNLPSSWKTSVKWAFPNPEELPAIRGADGSPADPVVVRCYLYSMLSGKSIELHPAVQRIRPYLNEEDLRAAAAGVYSEWLAAGAPAKQKAAVLFYALHSGDVEIIALQRQIQEWADYSRGALAADAVKAMVFSGSDLALMTVDGIGRKFKNKQVRRAGQEAFASAAQALGVSPEVLGDKIVPTLGFDQTGKREIDFGTRKFTATLTPALAVELADESGKQLKSLPKPGAKDDAEQAERAKKELSALKKSLKTVVATQSQRLELALATGRKWEPAAWEKLFVQNPIMRSFAVNLVWGAYNGDAPAASFRYMEDGTFADIEDEEYDFAAAGESLIGLVHPLDLGETLTERWREQLEDYDITQPFAQINRKIYAIKEEEKNRWGMDRSAGQRLSIVTLLGRLTKLGWYRGSVQDAGGYYTFYKEIDGLGMQLYFSGTYVGAGPEEIVTLGEACFYRAGSVERGSYVYDDIKKETAYKLGEVSPRMFSELVLDLETATAGADYDEKWDKEWEMRYDFDKKKR